MTMRAQVIGTRYPRRTHHGEHWLGAQFPILRVVATGTWQLLLIRSRGFILQQFAQSAGSRLMKGCPQRDLDCLQIRPSVLTALRKDTAQQLVYFPRHLLMNRSNRFFS